MSLLDNFKPRFKRLSFYSALSGLTLFMGLLREVLVASYYGLSSELDVYVALNSLYLLFGVQLGNALEQATIANFGRNPTVDYLRSKYVPVLLFLLAFNVVIGVIVVNFDYFIIGTVFKGFSDYQLTVADNMIIFILLSFILANISGFNRGNLNIIRCFSTNFLNGALISAGVMLFVYMLFDKYGINALAIGFLFGNLIVFLLYLYLLVKKNVISLNSPQSLSFKPVVTLLKASGLIVIGEVLYQFYVISIRSNASDLGEGVISSFFYANALLFVPITLVMYPLTTILFPKLTKLFADKDMYAKTLLRQSLFFLLGFSLLAAVAMHFVSFELIKIVFVRGEFTVDDAVLTASIFSVLVFMLPALSLSRVVKMAHYAIDSFKLPIYSNLVLVVAILTLSYLLVPDYGIFGLSLSAVLSIYLSVISLYVMLNVKMKSWYN